jgi:hypothetical protein
MKRNTTSLVEHHKVYNGRSRYKQTIITYNKEYPWPCMIPLDETYTLKLEGLPTLNKNPSCLNLWNWNQRHPFTKSNCEDS